MTGTSLDGLDAALVQIRGQGLSMSANYMGMVSQPLGDELAAVLRAMAEGQAHKPIAFMQAARQLGELHADAVAALCEQHLPAGTALDSVVAHGQTIWHQPAEQLSWQLFDPWPVARRLGVRVRYDLRQADLVAGGQGAPVTPTSDWVLYRKAGQKRAIVNLGGICNITVLGDALADIRAADVCPCNILLDGAARRLLALPYDASGEVAQQGQADEALVQQTLAQVRACIAGQRSLGREQLGQPLLDQWVAAADKHAAAADILASYVAAVAMLIAEALKEHAIDEVVLAGGGARNRALVAALAQRVDARILLSDELGIPIEAREAVGFAVLGALSDDGVPVTLPQVTGATNPGIAGSVAADCRK